jgi:Cysteine-rich CPCC
MEYHTCPACGFKMFDELPGSFDTCEICWWEDDVLQLRNPLENTEGSNQKNLYDWQQEVLETYPLTVETVGEFMRDITWRPIRADELPAPQDIPENGLDYFYTRHDDEATYYWQRTPSP